MNENKKWKNTCKHFNLKYVLLHKKCISTKKEKIFKIFLTISCKPVVLLTSFSGYFFSYFSPKIPLLLSRVALQDLFLEFNIFHSEFLVLPCWRSTSHLNVTHSYLPSSLHNSILSSSNPHLLTSNHFSFKKHSLLFTSARFCSFASEKKKIVPSCIFDVISSSNCNKNLDQGCEKTNFTDKTNTNISRHDKFFNNFSSTVVQNYASAKGIVNQIAYTAKAEIEDKAVWDDLCCTVLHNIFWFKSEDLANICVSMSYARYRNVIILQCFCESLYWFVQIRKVPIDALILILNSFRILKYRPSERHFNAFLQAVEFDTKHKWTAKEFLYFINFMVNLKFDQEESHKKILNEKIEDMIEQLGNMTHFELSISIKIALKFATRFTEIFEKVCKHLLRGIEKLSTEVLFRICKLIAYANIPNLHGTFLQVMEKHIELNHKNFDSNHVTLFLYLFSKYNHRNTSSLNKLGKSIELNNHKFSSFQLSSSLKYFVLLRYKHKTLFDFLFTHLLNTTNKNKNVNFIQNSRKLNSINVDKTLLTPFKMKALTSYIPAINNNETTHCCHPVNMNHLPLSLSSHKPSVIPTSSSVASTSSFHIFDFNGSNLSFSKYNFVSTSCGSSNSSILPSKNLNASSNVSLQSDSLLNSQNVTLASSITSCASLSSLSSYSFSDNSSSISFFKSLPVSTSGNSSFYTSSISSSDKKNFFPKPLSNFYNSEIQSEIVSFYSSLIHPKLLVALFSSCAFFDIRDVIFLNFLCTNVIACFLSQNEKRKEKFIINNTVMQHSKNLLSPSTKEEGTKTILEKSSVIEKENIAEKNAEFQIIQYKNINKYHNGLCHFNNYKNSNNYSINMNKCNSFSNDYIETHFLLQSIINDLNSSSLSTLQSCSEKIPTHSSCLITEGTHVYQDRRKKAKEEKIQTEKNKNEAEKENNLYKKSKLNKDSKNYLLTEEKNDILEKIEEFLKQQNICTNKEKSNENLSKAETNYRATELINSKKETCTIRKIGENKIIFPIKTQHAFTEKFQSSSIKIEKKNAYKNICAPYFPGMRIERIKTDEEVKQEEYERRRNVLSMKKKENEKVTKIINFEDMEEKHNHIEQNEEVKNYNKKYKIKKGRRKKQLKCLKKHKLDMDVPFLKKKKKIFERQNITLNKCLKIVRRRQKYTKQKAFESHDYYVNSWRKLRKVFLLPYYNLATNSVSTSKSFVSSDLSVFKNKILSFPFDFCLYAQGSYLKKMTFPSHFSIFPSDFVTSISHIIVDTVPLVCFDYRVVRYSPLQRVAKSMILTLIKQCCKYKGFILDRNCKTINCNNLNFEFSCKNMRDNDLKVISMPTNLFKNYEQKIKIFEKNMILNSNSDVRIAINEVNGKTNHYFFSIRELSIILQSLSQLQFFSESFILSLVNQIAFLLCEKKPPNVSFFFSYLPATYSIAPLALFNTSATLPISSNLVKISPTNISNAITEDIYVYISRCMRNLKYLNVCTQVCTFHLKIRNNQIFKILIDAYCCSFFESFFSQRMFFHPLFLSLSFSSPLFLSNCSFNKAYQFKIFANAFCLYVRLLRKLTIMRQNPFSYFEYNKNEVVVLSGLCEKLKIYIELFGNDLSLSVKSLNNILYSSQILSLMTKSFLQKHEQSKDEFFNNAPQLSNSFSRCRKVKHLLENLDNLRICIKQTIYSSLFSFYKNTDVENVMKQKDHEEDFIFQNENENSACILISLLLAEGKFLHGKVVFENNNKNKISKNNFKETKNYSAEKLELLKNKINLVMFSSILNIPIKKAIRFLRINQNILYYS